MWTSNDSATLWPVNDVAARRFALRFYAYRKRGKPKAAAYQEAVHDLLRGKFNT
jgi:CHAT domain-containing protein